MLLARDAYADRKISELTADTSPTSDDLMVTVNDPATLASDSNRKVTLGNLFKSLLGSGVVTSGNILVANGTQFNSVAMSGDATITSAGVVTVTAASSNTSGWVESPTENIRLINLNGKVGIGTSAPGALVTDQGDVILDVQGNISNVKVFGPGVVAGTHSFSITGSNNLSVGQYFSDGAGVGNGFFDNEGVGSLAAGVSTGASQLMVLTGISGNAGRGAIAAGYSRAGSQLFTAADGAYALGYSNFNSVIQANARGSLAGGNSDNNGDIEADSPGSFAWGSSKNRSQIASTEEGAVALGYADGSVSSGIYSSGFGSLAAGYATGAFTFEAAGNGSVALGQNVKTTGNNEFLFGNGATNNAVSSFQVNFLTAAPMLHVEKTRVGIATSAPTSQLEVMTLGKSPLAVDSATGQYGDYLIIDRTGKVGIGTSVPAYKLDVIGSLRVSGNVVGGVQSLTGLSDIGSATITAGNLLIADGTDFQSVAMSSDCVIASSGATTCTGARPGNAIINQTVCWKTGTNSLGYCSSVVGVDGTCTCN